MTRADRFAAFWSAYPRKVGKRAAWQAFERAEKRGMPPVDQVVKAIEVAKRSRQWQKDGGAFIPYPSTWLNQDRWEDDLGSPASAPATSNDPLATLRYMVAETLRERGFDPPDMTDWTGPQMHAEYERRTGESL